VGPPNELGEADLLAPIPGLRTVGSAPFPVHFPAMGLLFASTNLHKVREVRGILGALGIEVSGLADVGRDVPAPVEDAATLEGNARVKAIAYARALARTCLADDSGLEVNALGGAPGAHSAVYAGSGKTREERDRANREKLLAEIRKLGVVDRSARLVCTLCLANERGVVLFEARGTCDAVITEEARGGQGFGYDRLLLLPDVRKTVAELSAGEWNARSHRGAAVRALHAWLVNNPSTSECR
jgi:XTP/dITP diphosphohydrolase